MTVCRSKIIGTLYLRIKMLGASIEIDISELEPVGMTVPADLKFFLFNKFPLGIQVQVILLQ